MDNNLTRFDNSVDLSVDEAVPIPLAKPEIDEATPSSAAKTEIGKFILPNSIEGHFARKAQIATWLKQHKATLPHKLDYRISKAVGGALDRIGERYERIFDRINKFIHRAPILKNVASVFDKTVDKICSVAGRGADFLEYLYNESMRRSPFLKSIENSMKDSYIRRITNGEADLWARIAPDVAAEMEKNPGLRKAINDEAFLQHKHFELHSAKIAAREWATEVGATLADEAMFVNAHNETHLAKELFANSRRKDSEEYLRSENIAIGTPDKSNIATNGRSSIVERLTKEIRRQQRPSNDEITAFNRIHQKRLRAMIENLELEVFRRKNSPPTYVR